MKEKILQFLYIQVQTNKIPQIKKGMVEEFEAFIEGLIADKEADKIAERMAKQAISESDKSMNLGPEKECK